MKTLKYFTCIYFLVFSSEIFSQDQSIFVFDPNGISTSFQFTLSQLTEDSVFVADSLDDSIYNYDAAFLFIDYQSLQTNVDRLINYTATGKPTYLVSNPYIDSTSLAFWNHIGLDEMAWLATSTLVDSVIGIDTTFTSGIVIDTSFMSGSIPALVGTMSPILNGMSESIDIQPTYISTIDTLNVILDLYNLIDDYGYLNRVLEHFGLIPPNAVNDGNTLVIRFELFQNYPNPFNPTTNIEYRIADFGMVSLKVYDVLGNEIATLVHEEKVAGNYEVQFDGTGLPSGIYFYQLIVGEFKLVKKMILIL